MSDFIQLVLNQLTVPPGDLIYYIVLVFVIASALQSAFNHWRASEFPQAKRAFIGLGVLLFAQIFMFIFSGLGWQELVDPKSILPPMDRGFLAFAIIWITWLYAFPEPNRSGDAVATLLSMFIFTALGLSLISWNQQIANPEAAVLSYNLTLDDLFWQIGSLIFAALGMAVIFIRKPDGMWYGILLLLIGFLGHLGQLLIGLEGDFPGIVRLAYMAAMPILLTLPQRFSAVNIVEPPLPVKPTILKSDTQGRPERRRYSTDPKTFHALLAVAAENNSTKMSQAITRATAQTMLADLCFMIYLTDENKQMVIAGGYDLIREDSLEGGRSPRAPSRCWRIRSSADARCGSRQAAHRRISRVWQTFWV